MDQYSLNLFLTLAETLHFGRTSQICNISRSALSRQIQRIEDELGQQLFERDNRAVTMTPAGRRFAEYAAGVTGMWRELKEDLLEEKTVLKGELSLYCSVTACYSILPDVLAVLRRRYPEIHIRVKTGEASMAVQNVMDGRADIAIAAKPDRLSQNIGFTEIRKTPLVFIVPAENWTYSGMPCEDVPWEDVPMILPERELARTRVEKWFRSRGIKPNIYAQVSGNEAILAMVSLGYGAGVVPELVVEKRPFEVNVDTIEIKPPLEPYSVGICVLQRRLGSPLLRAFWDCFSPPAE